MTELHPSIAEFAEAALRLSLVLTEADEAQWQRSRIISPDEDVEENDYAGGSLASRGQHSDPTFDAVSDPARWALRARVVDAQAALAQGTQALREHATVLQQALDRWNGGL